VPSLQISTLTGDSRAQMRICGPGTARSFPHRLSQRPL
jgi:hypothetical protein